MEDVIFSSFEWREDLLSAMLCSWYDGTHKALFTTGDPYKDMLLHWEIYNKYHPRFNCFFLPLIAIYFQREIPPHFYIRGHLFFYLWPCYHLELRLVDVRHFSTRLWLRWKTQRFVLHCACFVLFVHCASMNDVTNSDGSLQKEFLSTSDHK